MQHLAIKLHRSELDAFIKSSKSLKFVIPAKAGIQKILKNWIPVFTGMTRTMRDRNVPPIVVIFYER